MTEDLEKYPYDHVTELNTLINNLKTSYSLLGGESLDAQRHDARFAQGLGEIARYVARVANENSGPLEGPFETALCDLVTFISNIKPKGFKYKLDSFQELLFDLSTTHSLNKLSSLLHQTLNPRRHSFSYWMSSFLGLGNKKKIE